MTFASLWHFCSFPYTPRFSLFSYRRVCLIFTVIDFVYSNSCKNSCFLAFYRVCLSFTSKPFHKRRSNAVSIPALFSTYGQRGMLSLTHPEEENWHDLLKTPVSLPFWKIARHMPQAFFFLLPEVRVDKWVCFSCSFFFSEGNGPLRNRAKVIFFFNSFSVEFLICK